MTEAFDLEQPINGWGVDRSPEKRPGVPMEADPHPAPGAHWTRPERQQPTVKVFKRVGLEELTPVFGTTQPPRGVSGLLRALGYRIPEHKASHWATLLFADRVDVVESALVRAAKGKPGIGLLAVGAIAGGLLVRRAIAKRARRKIWEVWRR